MRLRHLFLFLLTLLFILPVHGQDEAGSNIVSKTFLSSDGTRKIEQRLYDNGLGDIVQEVQSYPGSSIPSVVVQHYYDEYRRKVKTWLPVTSSGSDYVMSNQLGSHARSQYSDAAPFTRTVYDSFLPSQPAAIYKAGSLWQDNDKKVSVSYSEYVGPCVYSPEDGYIYVKSNTTKYLCTKTYDEDGGLHAEYTDLNGRLMISQTGQQKTFYTYNQWGDISHVIPNALFEDLVSRNGTDSPFIADCDEMMQKYAYIYRYDHQRHCIYKKLPACDSIYYVYDRAGNCILTQDGVQRQRGEWTYSIPDKFGRPCISGICHNSIVYNAEPLHAIHVYAEYDGTSTQTGGYAVRGLALVDQTLYTAAYYDDYSFIGHHGVPASLTASAISGFSIDMSLGRGLQTGSAIAILKDGSVNGYIYTTMYYDSRYQVAQVKSTNHLGTTDVTCTEYSYTGKPLNVRIRHAINNTNALVEDLSYSYDDADRLISCNLSITAGRPSVSSVLTYQYDELGRLSKITRPFTNGEIDYTYDLHGWPTGITTNSFCEELFYADGRGTPCYNGNISSMKWENNDYYPKRGYKFTYDNANRLTQAKYGEGEALASNVNRFSENIGYNDVDGNIRAITRYGKTSASGYGQMDNLTLSYDGYQLTGVAETAADYDATGTFEYKKINGTQYLYNANGSLVADKSRGIAYITYDVNNNPQTVYFTNGNETRYVYSATGEKLSVRYYVAKPNVTRKFGVKPEGSTQEQVMAVSQNDYVLGGKLRLQNGMINHVFFEGGYAKATPVSSITYDFAFFYYNQDHLGNNREVVNASGNVQQITNYYPFGAPYADPKAVKGSALQPYKYNGKELDLMHGLNTYDYGARQYDPILARWDRVDPLAEDEPDISPYVYCRNSPIIHIDQEGKFPLVSNVAGAIVGAATDYVCQVAANAIVNEGLSTECFTDVDSKSIMLSAGAGFISSGASAVGTSLGKAVATRTGSRIAGNIAERAAAEGTKYTANVVANNGDITKATKDYVVGKAVGLLNRKTVNPTSNNKAVKTAMERAKNNGKTLSVEQKKAIRIGNTMARKNAAKMNKSIECKNTIKKTAVDAAYYTYKHYEEKENR